MPNDLEARLSVDTSSFKAGVNDAAASVQSASERMASALVTQRASAANLTSAYKELGDLVIAGNQQATAALAEFVQENERAKAAVTDLRNAEDQEVQTLRSVISTRQAASAEIRILEGSFQGSTRAAGAFLSTLPGVGAAMRAAFPLFGAVALLGVLDQAKDSVVRLITAFHDLRGAEVQAAISAQDAGEKILKIKPSKTFSANDLARYLEGVPEDKTVEVPNAEAAKQQIANERQLADIRAQNLEKGKQGAALVRQQVEDTKREALYAADAAAKMQKLIDGYTKLLTAKVDLSTTPFGPPKDIDQFSDPGQRDALLKQREIAVKARDQFRQDQKVAETKLPGVEAREPGAENKDANKAAEARLHSLEAQLAQEKLAHDVSAADEEAYWTKYLGTFKAGSSEYDSVLQKMVAAKNKAASDLGRAAMQMVHDDEEYVRQAQQSHEAIVKNWEEMQKAATEAAKVQIEGYTAIADAAITRAKTTQETSLASVAAKEHSGAITKLAADYQVAGVKAEFYAEKLAALRKELAALQAQKDGMTPGQQAGKEGEDNDNQQQKVNKEISQTQAQSDVSAAASTTTITSDIAKPYLDAFNQIESGFMRVQQQMLVGHKTFTQALRQQEQQWVLSAIEFEERRLLNFLASQIRQTAAHAAAKSLENTQDAAGAAVSDSISLLSALKQVNHNAAVAAAKSFKAYADVPPVPVVGAIAAAATYASVIALAAFDQGTNYLPTDMIAQVHAGERIIPAADNRQLMDALQGGGGSGKTVHFSQTNHFNKSGGSDPRQLRDASMKGLYRAHAMLPPR